MLLIVFLLAACGRQEEPVPTSGPMFELLSPEQSGITFNNTIQEEPQVFNHLKWAAVYSGAGLAVGDIDNDDRPDIFFAGNMVADALYWNEGDLHFSDITTAAGIRQDQGWSTGITMADVNQDGLLDIYVCRFGWTLSPDDKRNLLYINNGDRTFTEQAAQYGINDGGFSTQATFFDMDEDGDLDLYVVNQPPDSRLISRYRVDLNAIQEGISDRLYRNDGTHFTDVTKEAGIFNRGYGLNAVASDLNGDGRTDIYVSNDYEAPDFLYINNGDNTFTNVIHDAVRHISFYSMGSDVADFNNDGLPDVVAVDMASESHFRSKTNMGSMRPATFWSNVAQGKHYQYMFNTLQLNNGNGTFSEIGQLAGISKTDWSWAVLLADFDNDGWKDLCITNGIKRDIRNNDFLEGIRRQVQAGNTSFDVMQLVQQVPSNPVPNYIYRNEGDYTFSKVTDEWGLGQPGFTNGAAFADLDQDGDLELIFNNVDAPASIYNNRRGRAGNYVRFRLRGPDKNPFAYNARIRIEYADQLQVQEITATRGYYSASETIAHFGLGDAGEVDKVTVQWPGGEETVLENVKVNRVHTVSYGNADRVRPTAASPVKPLLFAAGAGQGINYQHQENEFDDFAREILLPHKQSEHGPILQNGDVNGDGLADVFIGGAHSFAGRLYLAQADGTYQLSDQPALAKDAGYEDLGSALLDIDGDQDLDLYVTSGGTEHEPGSEWYQDRVYLNDGSGQFTRSLTTVPSFRESTQCVVAHDVDGDGDQDLFVGGRVIPGRYPAPASSYLLKNEGGRLVDATAEWAPELQELGLVTDAVFSDFDQDGQEDLIIVGEWMPITVFRRDGASFVNATEALGLAETGGWWWSIVAGDFDEDGDPDYLVGNLGKNKKFKASADKPFQVYQSDFDENGSNDVVLASYSDGHKVPVRGRECSSEQMPFIAEKFPTYQGFASASLEDIYTSEALGQANHAQVTSFASMLLRNENGRLQAEELPVPVQFAPVKDMVVLDVNADQHLDVLLVGNHYGAEVETSRYDAGIGTCLIGDGLGGFRVASTTESGLFVPYDARSIVFLPGKGEVIVASNKGPVQVYSVNR